MSDAIISVTEAAARHVQRVLTERSWPEHGLRFGLKDGGCSGYTYQLEFEPKPDEGDLIHEEHGVKVFIHPLHAPLVQGTILDYIENKFESRFDVQNPNAKRHCGCGESFDV